MTTERLPREERAAAMRSARRTALLAAALAEAAEHGYRNITRDAVARRAGLAAGSVNHEFETVEGLRNAVMTEAIETGALDIIRQGIANADPLAVAAPAELKTAALATI